MGLVNLEGKEKLFLLLNVLLNHRAEQCYRNLSQELSEGCLRVVPSPVTMPVRGCSAPPCLSFPSAWFPCGLGAGAVLGSLAHGRVGTGGPEVPPAPAQLIPLVWGHCSSGGFCGYPEQVITMENGTGAESKLLLEPGRFWGPQRVTGTQRSPVPSALSPVPCPLCPLLCPLCSAPCRAVPFKDFG